MTDRWKVLAALTFARAGMGFQFQSVAGVAPFISAELGLDKAQLGWLIGVYLLPGVVIAIPGGFLGARYGDKRVTLAALALMLAGGLWLPVAGSFMAANAARLVSGIGAVILNVLFTKMVADWFEGKERLLAMAILVNSWPIGIGLALLAIGPLSELAGWHWAIASAALFLVCGLGAVAAFYRAPAGAAQSVAGSGLKVLAAHEWRLLLIGSLPWLLYNAAYQIVVSFLPSLFLERGYGVSRSGAWVALNTLLFVVSIQAGGLLLKRSRKPDLLVHASMVVWAASLVALSDAPWPLLWIVLGGLIAGFPAGAFVSLPAEFLRPESRSIGMGVFYTIYYGGCAVLPSLAGAFYDTSGTARAALWMSAVLAFACIPSLLAFRSALARRRVTGKLL